MWCYFGRHGLCCCWGLNLSLWILLEKIEETYLMILVGGKNLLPSEKAMFPVLGVCPLASSGVGGTFWAQHLLGPDFLCWCLPAAERLRVGEGIFRPSGEGEGS